MQLNRILIICVISLFTSSTNGASSVKRDAPQSEPGTYEDLHAQQALGRVVVAPDGKLVLFEWGRPYLDWIPDSDWMSPVVARRLETTLYKVDLTVREPTSEYIFYPNAGATYWLGDLSPNSRHVAVFELDHDNRRVRAGAWSFYDQTLTWFKPPPDESRLEDATPWLSDTEFIYPVKQAERGYVLANFVTGNTQACTICSVEQIKKLKAAGSYARARAIELASTVDRSDVPINALLLSSSENGETAIYSIDDAHTLSLIVKQAHKSARILFKNARQWPRSSSTGTKPAQPQTSK